MTNSRSFKQLSQAAVLAICLSALGACSDSIDSTVPKETATSLLSKEIEKIEFAYTEGAVKIEEPVENPVVTKASPDFMRNLQEKIDKYYQGFDPRYRVAADYGGYSVGVVPATDNCGTEERIRYFMDNEDGGGSTASGWTGAWTMDGTNTWHTVCRVDGQLFKMLHLTPSTANGGPLNRTNYYAVIRLGNLKPTLAYYTDPYVMHHDSEDHNNKNISMPGQSGSNTYIARDVNGITLNFWIFYGNNNISDISTYMYDFPNLGFNYGVFGTETNYPVIANGYMHIDDENSDNANYLRRGGVDYTSILGSGVMLENGTTDSRYNFMRVR